MANVIRSSTLKRQMTGKERLAAAIKFGEVDRIPWAPKVFAGHYRSGTSPEHREMSIAEFADVLNCDAIGWGGAVVPKTANVTRETVRDGSVTTTITRTPVGEVRSASAWSEETQTHHPAEFPLKTSKDYDVAKYIAEHTTYEPAGGGYEKLLESVGDRGVAFTAGPSTPLMALIQGTIGMPYVYYHMADYPEAFDELYEVEVDRCCRHYEAIAKSDAEYVITNENTSTTLVSPDLYGKYCLPVKKKYCEIIKGAGKTYMLHMCGRLKGLLPMIYQAGADCWESFSPPPIGDTYFKDGRDAVGDDVSLVGGMNALTVSVWDDQEVLDYVDETIGILPHTRGIVFTSGGAMPIERPTESLAELGRKLIPHLKNVKN